MFPYATDSGTITSRSSSVFLIVANLIPLAGAFFLDWNVLDIVLVYWSETIIVGFYTILRIATVQKDTLKFGGIGGKIFISCFFLLHYGVFCFGNGVLLLSALAPEISSAPEGMLLLTASLKWSLLALFISHGYSYYHNYLGSGENKRTRVAEEMFTPYPRLITLHVAIILGGVAVDAAGQPLYLLLIFIIGKTYVDWKLHLRERKKRAALPNADTGGIETP